MGRTVKVTKGAEEQAKAGGGDFKPLTAGIYNVTIFEAEETEIGKGPNAGVPGARMQFRISDGQKGANRRVFNTVWDTERWAPKDGKKEGAVNFQFFQFYKALGVEFPEDGAIDLPEIEDLVGEPLAVKLKIVPDTYKYDKAVKEHKALEPDASDEKKHAAWEADKPQKSDFLTNEIAEFLPEQDLDDVADEDDSADEDEFDL